MTVPLLATLGARVRKLRIGKHWTIRELAERSGVSLRFLVQLEAGQANISVKRLAELADALGVSAAHLVTEDNVSDPHVVALLGLRGAGKTTIGKRLARQMHVRFVELDRRIEQAAEMSLSEIFSLYGEDYYRRLERETLSAVLGEDRPTVLATGGGIVASPETYALLKHAATTIWLRAAPEDHWNRVVAQGDKRPMADHPQAMADLRTLLEARQPLYATAHLVIETSGRPVEAIVDEVRSLVRV